MSKGIRGVYTLKQRMKTLNQSDFLLKFSVPNFVDLGCIRSHDPMGTEMFVHKQIINCCIIGRDGNLDFLYYNHEGKRIHESDWYPTNTLNYVLRKLQEYELNIGIAKLVNIVG